MKNRISDCPIDGAMVLLSGRWRALILYYLGERPMRFNELMRSLDGISQRMLTRDLRDLEAAGVISRTVYPEVPPRVVYGLADAGRRLLPIIDALADWWEDVEAERTSGETTAIAAE